MVEFTQNLSQPSGGPTARARQDLGSPLAGLLSDIGDGARQVRNKLAKDQQGRVEADENRIAKELREAGSELFNDATGGETAVQQPDEVDFLQQTENEERDAALQNENVRTTVATIEKLGQAKRQARTAVDQQRLFLRVNDIIKQSMNQDPAHAKFIAAEAKRQFGFEPLEKLAGLATAEAEFAAEQDRKQRAAFMDTATQAGFTGTQDQLVTIGQKLNRVQFDLDIAKQEADIAAANRLSDAQVSTRLASGAIDAFSPAVNDMIGGLIQDFDSLQDMPEAERAAAMQQLYQEKLTSLQLMTNRSMADGDINDPEAIKTVQDWLTGQFAPINDILSGDLSEQQIRINQLKDMQTIANIKLHESAPILATMKAIGGERTIAAMTEDLVLDNAEIKVQASTQLQAALGLEGQQTPTERVADTASWLSGQKTIGQFSDEQKTKLASQANSMLREYTAAPNELSPEDLGHYGRITAELTQLALENNDAEDLANAAKMLSNPSAMSVFTRWASDPNNTQAVPTVATNLTDLNSRAMQRTLDPVREPRTQRFDSQFLGTQASTSTQVVYNAETGKFEAAFEQSGTSLIDRQPNTEAINRIEQANANLNAIVALKQHAQGRGDRLNDQEYREFHALNTGIPVKEGTEASLTAGQDDVMTTSTTFGTIENPAAGSQEQVFQLGRATATDLGVDPDLVLAIITQESNGDQSAISGAGAIGAMQLMPGTAADLGVDPTDLNDNIKGGVTYIKQMLEMFDGDIELALAAYNAGPGNVRKHGGIPPFAETQNYVKKITSNLQRMKNSRKARPQRKPE